MRRALEKNAAERARLERELDANIRERLLLDQIARLHSVNRDSRVNTEMELSTAHKVAISAGRSPTGDKFLAHIQAAKPDGYSLRSLAAAVDVSPATLRAHRLPKSDPNHRPCPQSRADRIEELTDWPADSKHWPAGLS